MGAPNRGATSAAGLRQHPQLSSTDSRMSNTGRLSRLNSVQALSQLSEIHRTKAIAHLPIVKDRCPRDPGQTRLVALAFPAMPKTRLFEHRIVETPPTGKCTLFLQTDIAQPPIVARNGDGLIR